LILSYPRTKPQEPRRPRFSFFYLHNVKERTKEPSPVPIVNESITLSDFLKPNKPSWLVAQQINLLLFENASSGTTIRSSASLTWPGFRSLITECQHPFSFFTPTKPKLDHRYSENPKTQITLGFQWLASVPGTRWRRALKR